VISGVSGAPAHSTSCTDGSNWLAAASRCRSPFCRVIRPTKMADGRLGSIPYLARTFGPGVGWYSEVSMPL
jgi:hypothetical protein